MYCGSNIFVTSNESSILISCTTSLALALIKPHDRLDHLPPEGNVISSSADKLKDESQLKVHLLIRKPKLKSRDEKAIIVCSSDGQSKSNKEKIIIIYSNEKSSAICKRNTGDQNCQANKHTYMQPFKPAMNSVHMQSNRPAVPIQDKMSMQQIVPQEDDKNCQSTKYNKSVCSEKKCQDTHMQSVKPAMKINHMQSVTRSSNMKSSRPQMLQSSNKQHTYEKNPVKQGSMCSDKNCQETKLTNMQPVKPEKFKYYAVTQASSTI